MEYTSELIQSTDAAIHDITLTIEIIVNTGEMKTTIMMEQHELSGQAWSGQVRSHP